MGDHMPDFIALSFAERRGEKKAVAEEVPVEVARSVRCRMNAQV